MSKSFINKLQAFEVEPPASAWDNISSELSSNSELPGITAKLYNYEATPPADSWNAIKATLDHRQNAGANFSFPKFKKLPYLVTAAALIGAILAGVLYFNNEDLAKSKTKNNRMSTVSIKEPNAKESAAEVPSSAIAEIKPETMAEATVTLPLKGNNDYEDNKKTLQNTVVKNQLFPGDDLQVMIAAKPIRNANGEIIQNPGLMSNPVSRYISITGPNGEQTKISSKFLHMLLFLNDDSDIDQVDGYFDKNFLESLIWKSRFKDWRNEIISTSFVPSSANFMDILDFKDLITKER